MKNAKKLKDLKLTDKEDKFLQKVIVDIRNRGGLKEGKTKFTNVKDFPCKTIYYDIDNTLILYENFIHGRKDLIELQLIMNWANGSTLVKLDVAPHKKHIKMLKEFHKKGVQVIAWSFAGAQWAEKVCKALKLDRYVDLFLTKPEYYFDDLDSREWMGERVWFKDE